MIGIIILNYNQYHVTMECVESVHSFEPNEDYIIYIIDNGSSNDSLSVLQDKYQNDERVRVFGLKANVGFACGNNVGIELCEKDGITECVLANSDIIFQQGAIDTLIKDLRDNREAVIAGPHIELNGKTQHSSMLQRVRFMDMLEVGRLFPQSMLDEDNESGIHEVYSVSGCCFAVSIPLFRKMGAFDKNTFLYNEENILSSQAHKAGFKTIIDLNSSVIHKHGESSGKENDFVRIEYLKSSLYYWKTYRNKGKTALRVMINIYGIKMFMKRKNGLHWNKIIREGTEYYHSLWR